MISPYVCCYGQLVTLLFLGKLGDNKAGCLYNSHMDSKSAGCAERVVSLYNQACLLVWRLGKLSDNCGGAICIVVVTQLSQTQIND